MKKVLIASTALVAAGLMTTGTASAAEKIKLNLGGFSKWWVVGAWQDSSFEAGAAQGYANVDVKGDNEVFFGGSTKLDNGLEIGVDIQLEAGGHTETSTSTPDVIDESYIWIAGGFGKFIIGSENNGVYLLHVNAPDAAGNWGEGGQLAGGNASGGATAIVAPSTVRGFHGGNGTAPRIDNDAEKITYVAPTFYGLTLGASYIPNTSGTGSANKGEDSSMQALSQEAMGVGALYANTFGGVGVKLSTGYIWGDANSAGVAADFSQFVVGGQLSYAGFTVGGSWRRDTSDDKNYSTDSGFVAANRNLLNVVGWDAGIQYASGPWAVSFAYFQSEAEGDAGNNLQDQITIWQVSGKYNLSPGVDILASAGWAEFDDEGQKASGTTGDANHNEGWAVMTGLSLAF
ncbi:MAG: porin [Alphaproteobacteria bacterium]|nr:porin [Alphaproteobacteria bacterium]